MKRRNFLQSTITALAATGISTTGYSQSHKPPAKAFKVKAHQTRYKENITIADAPIDFKLLSNDTTDQLSVFISNNLLKGFGPPLHIHYSIDEFFCIMEGNFLFQVDDEIISMEKGDTLFVPRNVKHCFNYNGETSGSLLVSIFPGKGMEDYFEGMGKLVPGKGMPDMAALKALYKKYDSEILGPPMK